jgi:hypothetical protein
MAQPLRQPTPLHKLQDRVSGVPHEDSPPEPPIIRFPISRPSPEDTPIPRWGWAPHEDSSGRPPIPCQPPIPERPADDPGSEGEDGDDEAPQVVALKEGKHLSAWEVENEKRKGES